MIVKKRLQLYKIWTTVLFGLSWTEGVATAILIETVVFFFICFHWLLVSFCGFWVLTILHYFLLVLPIKLLRYYYLLVCCPQYNFFKIIKDNDNVVSGGEHLTSGVRVCHSM